MKSELIGIKENCNVTRGEVLYLAKRIRARDGCLGIMRRRRTRKAAISRGEPSTGIDPRISEWGNPTPTIGRYLRMNP